MGVYGGTAEASMSLNEVGNRADLNHDGVVDLRDWNLFGDKWAQVEVLLAADMDRDGVVGIRDWYIFWDNWLWKK